jgi:hypothetical protein
VHPHKGATPHAATNHVLYRVSVRAISCSRRQLHSGIIYHYSPLPPAVTRSLSVSEPAWPPIVTFSLLTAPVVEYLSHAVRPFAGRNTGFTTCLRTCQTTCASLGDTSSVKCLGFGKGDHAQRSHTLSAGKSVQHRTSPKRRSKYISKPCVIEGIIQTLIAQGDDKQHIPQDLSPWVSVVFSLVLFLSTKGFSTTCVVNGLT